MRKAIAYLFIAACSGIFVLNPAQSETFSTTLISGNVPFGQSDSARRPGAAGIHDSTANKTFVCWEGQNMNAVVRELNHSTGSWSSPQIVGHANCAEAYCYHDYPVMIQAADKRLNVFYSLHNDVMYQCRAPNASSASGTWTERAIPGVTKSGYPMPVVADNGDIYVFYRYTVAHTDRPIHYIKSTDNGATWSAPAVAIKHDPLRSDGYNEIYLGGVLKAGDKFTFVWTLSGGVDHDAYHANCYAAYFKPATGRFYNAGGTDLGTSINSSESDTHCLVQATNFNYNKAIGYFHVASFTDDGTMLVAYLSDANGQFYFKSARWNGTGWTIVRPTHLNNKNGDGLFDLEKFGPNSFRVYLSYNPVKVTTKGGDDVKIMVTHDGGLTWSDDGYIDIPEIIDFCFVMRPTAHKDAKLLIQEQAPKDNYCGCYKVWMGKVTSSTTNPAPTVSIASPTNGASYNAPATVPVSATASDNGSVAKVEFFRGSSLLGTDTTSPYSVTWSAVSAGSYTLTARATDNQNSATTSSGVNIVVHGTSSSGGGGTVTLQAIADTYVRDGTYASSNFGSSTTLQTKLENASYNRQTFLKFNISGVSGTVTSAKLRLYGKSSSTSGGSACHAYAVSDDSWTESGMTWNNKPLPTGSSLSSVTINSTAYAYREWTVTSFVASEKSAGQTTVSLILKHDVAASPNNDFNSREASANRPELVITTQ